MWLGLIVGAIVGLKVLMWTMEHISWGMQAPSVLTDLARRTAGVSVVGSDRLCGNSGLGYAVVCLAGAEGRFPRFHRSRRIRHRLRHASLAPMCGTRDPRAVRDGGRRNDQGRDPCIGNRHPARFVGLSGKAGRSLYRNSAAVLDRLAAGRRGLRLWDGLCRWLRHGLVVAGGRRTPQALGGGLLLRLVGFDGNGTYEQGRMDYLCAQPRHDRGERHRIPGIFPGHAGWLGLDVLGHWRVSVVVVRMVRYNESTEKFTLF